MQRIVVLLQQLNNKPPMIKIIDIEFVTQTMIALIVKGCLEVNKEAEGVGISMLLRNKRSRSWRRNV